MNTVVLFNMHTYCTRISESFSYCVSALEVESVVGDKHLSFQRTIKWAHVDDVFIWGVKQIWAI